MKKDIKKLISVANSVCSNHIREGVDDAIFVLCGDGDTYLDLKSHGTVDLMSEVLANLMDQDDAVAIMVGMATNLYMKHKNLTEPNLN